ncbi:MAG: hypothetical protein ACLFQJ_10415 [Campylobacterales bacterium]
MSKFTSDKALAKLGECINDESGDLYFLYKQEFITQSINSDYDPCEYCDVLSEFIIDEKVYCDEKIKKITRKRKYKTVSHDGKTDNNKGAKKEDPDEKIVAKKLFNKDVKNLGTVIDYEVPLKSSNEDSGVGKIDMISKKDKTLYFIELKKQDSKELILRAILELQSYYETCDREKLIKDFSLEGEITEVKKAILLFKDSKIANMYDELLKKINSKTIDLMKLLEIEVVIISQDEYDNIVS